MAERRTGASRGGGTSSRGAAQRGRSSTRAASGHTFKQLYDEAKKKGLKGRSRMNKAELEKALKK